MDEKILGDINATTNDTIGLRKTLFFELDRVRAGEISAIQANVIARLAGEILSTVRLEMIAFRHSLHVASDRLPDYPSQELEGTEVVKI